MSEPADYSNLSSIPAEHFSVYVSQSLKEIALPIVHRCSRAYTFLSGLLHIAPQFTLLILTPEDWSSYTDHPLYGMPHAYPEKLVVAGQNNDFWRSSAPTRESVSPEYYQLLQSVYGTTDDVIDVAPFFQLLALHELGHIFHDAVPSTFPRLWLMELFANLCLHTYIAEQEPDVLPILETLPPTFLAIEQSQLSYRSLRDFERVYSRMPPLNYVWYQGHLHRIAKYAYEKDGVNALSNLWSTFVIPDERILTLLREKVSPGLADLFEIWPATDVEPLAS